MHYSTEGVTRGAPKLRKRQGLLYTGMFAFRIGPNIYIKSLYTARDQTTSKTLYTHYADKQNRYYLGAVRI
jgi:hypothetical protein